MLTALLVLAAASPQAVDPLAEARAGKIQCVKPNVAAKTCGAMGRFEVKPDGVTSITTLLLAPTPLITMETRSPVKVEGGQLCSVITKEEYDAANVTMDGAPAEAAMAEGIKGQVVASLTPFIGKKACSAQEKAGDQMVAKVFLDGVARPELNQPFIWVSASDGYKLGA